jgi:putative inorganic carbon (hco3(-)) transporter
VAYSLGWVLLFLLSNQVRTVGSLDAFMRALRVVGWLVIAAGVYTLLFTNFDFAGRLKIFEMNENEVGVVLIVAMPSVIWRVLRQTGRKPTVQLALSVLFILGALVLIALTGSRGSSLSVLLVLLWFLFWKPVRRWGIVAFAVLGGMLVSAPFLMDTLVNRFAEKDGGALGSRDVLWQAGLQMLWTVPWTGVGVGNAPASLTSYIASLTSDFRHRVDLPSHNPILEVGLDGGVLGMLLFTLTWVSAVYQTVGSKARLAMLGPELVGYYPLVLGVAAGYFLSWIKGGGMNYHGTFYAMLALLIIPSQIVPDAPASVRLYTPGTVT